LAYVDVAHAAVRTELQIETGGRTCACRVVPTPFYKR
jgi:glycine cleavage system aminomethyltransferase T